MTRHPDTTLGTPRVSIIIPCYNAADWVAEAIESCLNQTYGNIEIVVIDDGSTDGSLEIIQSYPGHITYETGPNRGRCYARNRGFALSHGDYIQFLDADDYLTAEKIERQVRFLEATGADTVYGDWTYVRMRADGSRGPDEVEEAGAHEAVVEALLSGWWVVPHAVLYRRRTVAQSRGWDASVEGVEDSLFLIEVALSGARICYQPGSHCAYRRYGPTATLKANASDFHLRVALQQLIVRALVRSQQASPRYTSIVARNLFDLARECYERDRQTYEALTRSALELDPKATPRASLQYATVSRIFGFRAADRIALWKRRRWRGKITRQSSG